MYRNSFSTLVQLKSPRLAIHFATLSGPLSSNLAFCWKYPLVRHVRRSISQLAGQEDGEQYETICQTEWERDRAREMAGKLQLKTSPKVA